jgi:hypothetical protein
VRLDHLLSKEHTPRTIYRVPALVGAAVWWALVVFTSGIIDERRRVVAAVASTACPGFAWWVWNALVVACMGWFGTLLGPEESGRRGRDVLGWVGVFLVFDYLIVDASIP